MNEVWKDVRGFKGLYQASSFGRIFSFYSKKIMQPVFNRYGYVQVGLCKEGKAKTYVVHRVVAKSFIQNARNEYAINHKNGNKADNRIENLEWCDRQTNMNHAKRYGLIKSGELHGKSKLNNLQVRVIKHIFMIKNHISFKQIGRIFNITPEAIYAISANRIWKHVKI